MASGLTIAGLGLVLFLRRYASAAHPRSRHHGYDHAHEAGHERAHDDSHGHHHHTPSGSVSLRALFALGVTGGIVPCPAAPVVLLSAVALHRGGSSSAA